MTSVPHSDSEAIVAARNALTLAMSLGLTGGVALIVRLLVPRLLGPDAFGVYRLAEASAELLFVILTFGVDAHLRRQAAVDPARARGSLIGLAVLRVAAGVAIAALLAQLLQATGAHHNAIVLFWTMAAAQVLLSINNTYAAFEHAAGDVRWIARTNVAMKMVWAAAAVAVLVATPSAILLVLVTIAVELLRLAWLATRVTGPLAAPRMADVRNAGGVMVDSLPFFVNLVAHTLYARVGMAWLSAYGTASDMGLFGAAGNLAAIALLGMPLISWVLVPSAARAATRSDAELSALVASTLRVALLAVTPLALVTFAGSEYWLTLLFGPSFSGASPVLRVLAPTFVLAYASTVCAVALIQRGQVWAVATISLAGVAVTMLLDAVLIPWGAATGPGGAALGAAWATLGTEGLVAFVLVVWSRRDLAGQALLATAGAMASAVAIAWLVPRVVPDSDLALAAAALSTFVLTLFAAGGLTADDVAFGRRVVRVRRAAPMAPPVEVL